MDDFRLHSCNLLATALLLILLLAQSGCDISSPGPIDSDGHKTTNTQDDLTAAEILSGVRIQYNQAESYQDKAVLYLNYRLNGRAIQEPHPWSVAWNRKKQFSADWFNAQIRCDGNNFSCYVYDINSGNVDNQQLWLPVQEKLPLSAIQQDPIARHFIFGTSELLLDETEAEQTNPLVQPMIGFLDPNFMRPWLKSPGKMERLGDSKLDDTLCHRIQISHDGKEYLIWINQNSGIIEQIELPLQYLHSDVLAADEITNLKLFVRFHEAQLNIMVPPKRLVTEKKLAAKTVSRFIELPEPLPSGMIGEKVNNLLFVGHNGSPRKIEASETPTVLFWLSGAEATNRLKELESLQQILPKNAAKVFAVYSDEFLANPNEDSQQFAPPFVSLSKTSVPLLFDRGLETSVQMKIKAVPCLVVLDGNMRVQYAQGIDQSDWVKNASVVINRVLSGQDIAREMRSEYQQYLDQYHQQLVLAGNKTQAISDQSRQTSPSGNNVQWEITALQDPGNIHVPAESRYAYIIDGWQTIVRIDIGTGKEVKKFTLDLPAGAAINRLRSCRMQTGPLRFVAYSMLGKQAFVFDENFIRIAKFPENVDELAHDGITNCQWINEGKSLLCSFVDSGIAQYEIETRDESRILKTPTRTFCQLDNSLLHVDDNRFVLNSRQIAELAQIKAVSSIPIPNDGSRCLVVGVDNRSRWQLFCIAEDGKIQWSRAIESQYFDSDIESVTVGSMSEAKAIAVASSEGVLQLFDDQGNLIDTRSMAASTKGIGIANSENNGLLILSNGNVVCESVERQMTSSRNSRPADSRR